MEIRRYVTSWVSTNTYLCWDEETHEGFIVDPGDYTKKLSDDVNENGVNLKYILLTHAHGDHIGGVEQFKKEFPQVKVCVHRDDVEMLGDYRFNESMGCVGRVVEIVPDIILNGASELKVGNLDLKFIHTPGHTMGGICILADKYCFSGDTIFRYSVGRTDFYGGSWEELLKSIKNKIFALPDDTILLPGHMEYSTVGDEKKGNPFV